MNPALLIVAAAGLATLVDASSGSPGPAPATPSLVAAPVVTFVPVSTWYPPFVDAIRAHYPGSRGAPPGKKLAFQIFEDGQHRGWIGLGEPSYKLAPRRRLGLMDARPLPYTVNCFIYRLDAPGAALASDILRQWEPVAAAEWERRYGWRPVHWETMVEPRDQAVVGACFRKAGWRSLGMTTGRSARRPAGHTHGPRVWGPSAPKLVLYRGPLHRVG